MYKKSRFLLISILIIKMLVMAFVILYAGIGLGPDEAQYWTWSQDLDFGYYSKPPGIAWEIALGTWFFGNTEFGVRFLPLIIGFLLPLVVFEMGRRCKLTPQASLWAGICMALSPIGIIGSFLAITDGGMLLFWAVACAYLAGKLEQRTTPNYVFLGFLIFCGALFKWPIFALWLMVLGSWTFFPHLISRRIVLGMVISALALLPSVYWNATHEWATFRHVGATLAGGHAKPKEGVLSGNLLEFLGAQAALVSPVIFVLLVLAWHQLVKRKHHLPAGILFCGGVSFVSIAVGCILAFFMKMQGNWAIFAYPSAFVLLNWFVFDGIRWKQIALKAGIVLSVVLCLGVFAIPYLQSHTKGSIVAIPYKISPFRHNVGWQALAPALEKAGYDSSRNFLFADKYQTASILSFYGPNQKQTYFFNLQGTRKNQFSFWPGMQEERLGQTGFFAVIENIPQLHNKNLIDKYLQELSSYFEKVSLIDMQPLVEVYGLPVKGIWLFRCEGYLGGLPPETGLY